MKSATSIEVQELQYKIDQKWNDMQKRKFYPIPKTTKTEKDHSKVMMHRIKWNTIKRHMQKLQKRKNTVKVVQPPMMSGNLLDIINQVMVLQKLLIELSRNVANVRRTQMLCIIIHDTLCIIFNSYNLVVFLIKLANAADDVPLSLGMLLFFYGYHIVRSMTHISFSVLTYNRVYESVSFEYNSIRETATIMDELNIYILDDLINSRISQLTAYNFNNLRTFTIYGLYNMDSSLLTSVLSVTTTYIIILIQYSGDGEICKALNSNETQNHI